MIKLRQLLREQEEGMKCPVATQDISVNLEHRQKAIDEYGYGPLNPNNPNIKFWKKKAEEWQLDSMEEAKEMFNDNGIQGFQRFISYLLIYFNIIKSDFEK
jgi:hypothetical protein